MFAFCGLACMILRGCNDCNDWSLDLRKIFGQGETEWISDYDRMTSILDCFSRGSHVESRSLANNVVLAGALGFGIIVERGHYHHRGGRAVEEWMLIHRIYHKSLGIDQV